MSRVNHVIVLMQENHSFDNYFGALAYAPGSPYHQPGASRGADGGCPKDDPRCVDGLSCQVASDGTFACSNSNPDTDDGGVAFAFHDSRRCTILDLDHSWSGSHQEVNFSNPNDALQTPLNDGFVRVNDLSTQPDTGPESPTEDQTMSFYDQDEIPFYYALAQTFAISDRYFSSLLGPTFPNRSFFMAATSFGHLTTSDVIAPAGSTGYRPMNGTIFDLLERENVTWADYFSDVPTGHPFRPFGDVEGDPHLLPVALFLAEASGARGYPPLPQVSIIDASMGVVHPEAEDDEHPPTDIQRGQAFVSTIVDAVRNGPFWRDSVMFITYDEHGGFYDHVSPPAAPQGGARTPDGIAPGQCADLSNAPASLAPGGGANCSSNRSDNTDTSLINAALLCPELAADPTGPYPQSCASFDQLGFRVPFVAVSPFSRPSYVSHTVGDHTSMLAFIEQRFMTNGGTKPRPYLTARDQAADTLEDLFDFAGAPSLDATVPPPVPPPADDCTPALP